MRAAKRDITESSIVEGLRKCGYKVIRLDYFDLLVLAPSGFVFLLECKSPGGRVTPTQNEMIRDGWPLHFVKTVEEALEACGSRHE